MANNFLQASLVFVLLCASAWAGHALYRLLAENHRAQGPLEFVRLVSGLLVTFTALVLGLLLSQVATDFKKTDTDVRAYASMLVMLNQELEQLGTQALPPRRLLRQYTAATIAGMWADETKPAGIYPVAVGDDAGGVETPNLGDLLLAVESDVRRIDPKDKAAEKTQADCLARISTILDQRWQLINEAEVSISAPFFAMMVLWLMIVFASFGLTAPKGPLTIACIGMIAVSIAGAVFTIAELDGPLTGMIKVSGQPLRHALAHMDHSLGETSVQTGLAPG